MAEVIREGVIRIRLEQGEVTLKAPDIKPVEQAFDKQRKATEAASAASQDLYGDIGKLEAAYNAQVKATDNLAAAIDRQVAEMEAAEQQALSYFRAAREGLAQVGEGFFKVARAAVLLGVDSEESLGTLIRDLARVQAAFDLFRGISDIVHGASIAVEALAAAYTKVTVAAGSATVAQTAFAASAKRAATAIAGVAAVLSNVVLIVGIVAAAIYGLYKLFDFLYESEAEAAERARKEFEKLDRLLAEAERIEADAEKRARERNAILYERMTIEEKLASLAERRAAAENTAGNPTRPVPGQSGIESMGRERDTILDGIRAIEQQEEIERERLRAALEIRDAKIDEIEQAERLVSLAQRAYDLEEKKLRSFQAQIGAASKLEQQQLIAIRDKLRAGQDITAFEENQLAQLGGEQGRNIVESRRAARGAAAGFGEDFFAGIDGASDGMKDAAAELAKAAEKLNELTNGAGAAEAIVRLEKEKAELERQYEAFYQKNSEALAKLVAALEQLDYRITKIREKLLIEAER